MSKTLMKNLLVLQKRQFKNRDKSLLIRVFDIMIFPENSANCARNLIPLSEYSIMIKELETGKVIGKERKILELKFFFVVHLDGKNEMDCFDHERYL